MGNNQNAGNHTTEMHRMNQQPPELVDHQTELHQCCGFTIYKSTKSTYISDQALILWQETIVNDCTLLKGQARWAQQIIHLVNTSTLSRRQFVQQVEKLKQQPITQVQEEPILLTPSEIDNFKANLKKSVLLSFGQANQNQKMREGSRISSTIVPRKTKKKDMYIDQFRKSTILRENSLQKKSNSMRSSILSFVDDTISSLFHGETKDVSKQTAVSLELLVNFTMILENHLNNQQNILCLVKNCFISSIIKTYSEIDPNVQVIEYLTNNIKQFLVIMKRAIYYFYNLHILGLEEEKFAFIVNEQNLLTIITTILFKNEKFYAFFFDLLKKFHRSRELKFRQIMKKMDGRPPSYFEIKTDYCLDHTTLKKFINENVSVESNFQNLRVEELQLSDEPPYYKCFLALKEISKTRTPIAKLKIIMDCSQKITESVKDFYDENQMNLKSWVLDADQILSVFCYIIASTKIPHLHSHLFILEHFATDHQLISVTGYYYSVLTCAIEQLQNSYEQDSDIY